MSDINFKDNITLIGYNTKIKLSCKGCIYEKSPTAEGFFQPNICSVCARDYEDYYTSTAVPLKKDKKEKELD